MLFPVRLGVSAAGDGVPGHLSLSCSVSEAAATAHTNPLGGGVGPPLAHLQDHAGSCTCVCVGGGGGGGRGEK